eukprot:m.837135 g.837135  ORF g.837135 m.837135 type:complete len:57 (+) comp23460_c0_seq20:257-427(+)
MPYLRVCTTFSHRSSDDVGALAGGKRVDGTDPDAETCDDACEWVDASELARLRGEL